jgi:hypothetical protein
MLWWPLFLGFGGSLISSGNAFQLPIGSKMDRRGATGAAGLGDYLDA